jgi:hypothetical protein
MKTTILSDVMSCNPVEDHRRFGDSSAFISAGRRVNEASIQQAASSNLYEITRCQSKVIT